MKYIKVYYFVNWYQSRSPFLRPIKLYTFIHDTCYRKQQESSPRKLDITTKVSSIINDHQFGNGFIFTNQNIKKLLLLLLLLHIHIYIIIIIII